MDRSLDEMIKSHPRTKKTARRPKTNKKSPREQILGKAAAPSAKAAKAITVKAKKPVSAAATPSDNKVLVSNLPFDVNEQQIKELFSSTVGPLREATLHFDSNGRSKGTASVLFKRQGDGTKAYEQYNNRLIDGKRPMRIEVVMDLSKVSTATLASRVAPAPAAKPASKSRPPRRRNAKPAKVAQTPKTAADLDAEMEDYSTSGAAPTA